MSSRVNIISDFEFINIMWFRKDLRLHDNQALLKAAEYPLLAIYILNEQYILGSASKWWLYHSLSSLNKSLGMSLNLYSGKTEDIFLRLLETYKVNALYYNNCYEPFLRKEQENIEAICAKKAVLINNFHSSLLWPPDLVKKEDKTAYKVFTPFYQKGCKNAKSPHFPLEAPKNLNLIRDKNAQTIESLNLLPQVNWYKKLANYWQVGEDNALKQLDKFIGKALQGYKLNRDYPAKHATSRLSPFLHFGEISPNKIWHDINRNNQLENNLILDINHFLSEIGWREFSYYLLYHFPGLPSKNMRKEFDLFPWSKANEKKQLFTAWKKGKTGIPIVDAGMRQLWEEGYIHNRVRMIVASFLVKNLLISWQCGAEWFMDCLVDADLANNSAGWQWVAGSGADGAPYFRIFNPILQGQKFDPEGIYTKYYVPELEKLPLQYLFEPWQAPKEILDKANIILGKTYPFPIVCLKDSREKALEAYKKIEKSN